MGAARWVQCCHLHPWKASRARFLLGKAEGPQEEPAQRGLRGSGHCDQQPARHCSRLSLGSKPPVKGAERASRQNLLQFSGRNTTQHQVFM